MSSTSPLPEPFFPKSEQEKESMLNALDNYIPKSYDQIKAYRLKIDKDRIAQPKKGKKQTNIIKQDE